MDSLTAYSQLTPTLLADGAGDFSLFVSWPDVAAVAPILAAMLAIVSTITAAYFIAAWRNEMDVWIRLLGSLMALCIALAANNWFVYFFALVVIATLITELDFLERVVALFWGRDKYWDWMMQKQTSSEVKDKVFDEVKEELEATSGDAEPIVAFATTDLVSEALAFEKAVQFSLVSGNSPFRAHKVTTNRKIVSFAGNEAEIDAIVVTKEANFVVEIRYSVRPSLLPNVVVALRRAVVAYGEFLFQRSITKKIVPVAVVPAKLQVSSAFRNMLVLRFDMERSKFVNEAEFWKAYRNWNDAL